MDSLPVFNVVWFHLDVYSRASRDQRERHRREYDQSTGVLHETWRHNLPHHNEPRCHGDIPNRCEVSRIATAFGFSHLLRVGLA